MSSIPAELLEFFDDDIGKTLLVKGNPGTGKTTFSLSLLKELSNEKNGVYLSTRVDSEKVFSMYPWLQEAVAEDNVVDAVDALQKKYGKERPEKGNLQDYFITSLQYSDQSDFLKIIFEKCEHLEEPVIAVDSWDAILGYTYHFGEQADREKLEQTICNFAYRTGTNFILVTEYTDLRPLDYYVDGVVTLHSEEEEAGRVRSIELNKLRNTRIKSPRYVFTLQGYRFKSFNPLERSRPSEKRGWEVVPDPEGAFSTGSPDLDRVLGGYPRGGFVLLDIDPGVPDKVFGLFARVAIMNAIEQGRAVFMRPPLGFNLDRIERGIKPYIREGCFDRCVDVVGLDKLEEVRENRTLRESYRRCAEREVEVEERTGKPMLRIAGLDTLEYTFGKEPTVRVMGRAVADIAARGGTQIVIAKPGLSLTQIVANISTTHIKLFERHGTTLMYGVKPRTGLYVVERDDDHGYPQIELTEVD